MNTRTCIHCQKLKEIESGFYFIKRSQSYDTRCKVCIRESQRARNKADGGAAVRKCYQKRKAEGKIKPVPYREKTKAQKKAMVEAVKRWRQKNRERFSDESSQGIAMRRSIPYRKAWPLIVAHYGGKCLNCGNGKTVFDHVIPLSQKGANALTNGQPLCMACNTFKGQTEATKDFRSDKGAWIIELVKLNPWMKAVTSGHPRGWHLQPEGRKFWGKVKEQAGKEIVMPKEGGLGSNSAQIAPCVGIPYTPPPLADDLAAIIGVINEKAPTVVM